MNKPKKRILKYDNKRNGRNQAGNYTERSQDEYHTARWTRESKRFRKEHPICEECQKKGIIRKSECTDHIIPPKIYGDFWDSDNWQALCLQCNRLKGLKDKELYRKYRDGKRNKKIGG